MHDHLSHIRDSAPGRGAGAGATIDLPTEISRLQHGFADSFPAQLTKEDQAELTALLVNSPD